MLLLLVLAVVQGLTEYLPVSSSGHLVLIREFFGADALPDDASVEVLLHLGTLAAVLVFYRQRIASLLLGVLGRGDDVAGQRALAVRIFVGLLPLLPMVLAKDWLEETLFDNTLVPSIALLVTGTLLWVSRRLGGHEGADLVRLTLLGALLIGVAQAVAITPGISRSGATIVAGLALGLSVEAAAAFSFLLSIPAILGASVLKLPDAFAEESMAGTGELLAATVVSAVVGYLALGMLLWIAKARRLSWFAPYCWLLGLVCLGVTLA